MRDEEEGNFEEKRRRGLETAEEWRMAAVLRLRFQVGLNSEPNTRFLDCTCKLCKFEILEELW